MATEEPRIPECVEPPDPMNLGAPVLEVGCEPGDPPTDSPWKCARPFPRRITVQWTTGAALNGFFPLGRTPETHGPMNPPFVHLISNTETSFELTGQDPIPTMSFVLNDLVASLYYDLIRSNSFPDGSQYWNSIHASLYTMEAEVTGKTLTLMSQKTDESWWDGVVGAGSGPFGGECSGPIDPFTPILGVQGCQKIIPFQSLYKNFIVGAITFASCQHSTVTCIEHPTMPGPVLSFRGSIASGFVALNLPGNDKAAEMSSLGDRRHLAFVGFLPCDVPQDDTVTFNERLSYIGGSALATSVGWPAFGHFDWSAEVSCDGTVTVGPVGVVNGFQTGPTGFPAAVPITIQFSFTD